ncbi:hypothetical protein [Pseudarthrobacter sp. LMD1-1-1.1]|uniref:hypothetical protein n=1 Tax=Pseudarthrobacter sp. LMD1-1-1.1 TaxID=3135242 RepID=UPI00343C3EBB
MTYDSPRMLAAMEALRKDQHHPFRAAPRRAATLALAAADEVMFSDGAAELVSETLRQHREGALRCYIHDTGWCCECGTHEILVPWREHASRAVVKAMKGAADVRAH